MDDQAAAAVGVPPVDVHFKSELSEQFKDMVQAAFLKRLHDEGTPRVISRVELHESHGWIDGPYVEARVFGLMDQAHPIWRVMAKAPEDMANRVYERLGGTLPKA